MAETKNPNPGRLSALFSEYYDALSPEERERLSFSAFPNSAYDEILRLQRLVAHYQNSAESFSQLCSEVLGLLKKAQRRNSRYVRVLIKLQQVDAREKKRLAKINPKIAREANKQRAAMVRDALSSFVSARVKRNPHLTPEELFAEMKNQNWARKNKGGTPFSSRYLKSLIAPLMKKAKADARKL